MNRESAKQFLDGIAHLEVSYAKLVLGARAVEDDEELQWVKQRLKDLLTSSMDIFDRVIDQYPEFDPQGEGEELWFELRKQYETPEFPVPKMTQEEIRSAEEAGDQAAREIRAEMEDPNDDNTKSS